MKMVPKSLNSLDANPTRRPSSWNLFSSSISWLEQPNRRLKGMDRYLPEGLSLLAYIPCCYSLAEYCRCFL